MPYKKLQKKSDYDYMKEWSEHELKRCFAYELAIRFPEYKQEIANALRYYQDNKKDIDIIIVEIKNANKNNLYALPWFDFYNSTSFFYPYFRENNL